MTNTIFTSTYAVNTLVIQANKQLALTGLLGMLQDAAWKHADELGFGYTDLSYQSLFWVLSRQHVYMKRWPVWGETIKLVTWPAGTEGIFAKREFEIWVDEEYCGCCSTDWLMVDVNTKRPAKPSFKPGTVFGERLTAHVLTRKLTMPEQMYPFGELTVKRSDIDVNYHVNNVKYAQWLFDYLPKEIADKTIGQYEVNFLAEASLDDEIVLTSNLEEDESLHQLTCSATRKRDGKNVFIAQLTFGE